MARTKDGTIVEYRATPGLELGLELGLSPPSVALYFIVTPYCFVHFVFQSVRCTQF